MRWWDRDARIAWELDELTRAGYRFEAPASTTGAFTLIVYVTIDEEEQRLEVDVPDLYPYFRFEVRAPRLDLPHHQHPFGKNLCLIPRGTEHWDMSKSLAWYLENQLPKAVSAGLASRLHDVAEVEDHQAEPITTYYEYYGDAMILIDSAWALPDDFTVGRITMHCDHRAKNTEALRGTVSEVKYADGRVLFTAPTHLRRDGYETHGNIVKLDTPHLEANPANFAARMRSKYRLSSSGRTDVLAVVMPEEHAWRKQTGQGWLFIVSDKNKGSSYFARSGRAGAKDLLAREPELDEMRTATIALFGLGCNGAISAVELAKAGTKELRLADHDFLDPGTLLRWYLGLPFAGRQKADLLTDFINANYPLTAAISYIYRVGGGDTNTLTQISDGVSLLYDATAEPGVSYFLSEFARHHGVPYIHVSSTQGGWGGVIVRLNGDTGCWYCLQAARRDGRIPAPPADQQGVVQPIGCSDPTFMGAGFDLATIALAGVRTAVATLSPKYPSDDWDVTVISLRDEHGKSIPPTFRTFKLPKDRTCSACGSASATPAR